MSDDVVYQPDASVIVLAQYDLSEAMRAKIVKRFGGRANFLTATALRRRRPLAMIRYLRSFKAIYVIVAAENQDSMKAAPILKSLAAMISAREYFLFRWDGGVEPFSRTGQIVTALKVMGASLYAIFAMRRIRTKITQLVATPRINVRPSLERKAIAYINSNLSFSLIAGGSIGHAAGVVNAFAESGFDVKYFGTIKNRLIRKIDQIMITRERWFCLPFDANQYIFTDDVVGQVEKHDINRCCFIYQRVNNFNFSGVELSRKFNIPLIAEYNGSEVWISQYWGGRIKYEGLARAVEESMLRHAHLVVTISAVLRDELLSRGVEPDRIVLYPNCVDPAIFDPARFSHDQTEAIRQRLRLPQDACVVMFIGTFGPWHGAEVLADALLTLVEHEQARLEASNAVFVFVGAGITMSKVQAMLDRPSVERFVRFTGLVPQELAPEYLAAADICVSPQVENPDGSRFFGSPIKLFEYMAMEKPIIASDIEQVGEVLSPGINLSDEEMRPWIDDHPDAVGMLVTPGCVDELAQAILFLAEAPEWRRHLGENARAEVLAKYTWQTHVGVIRDRIAAMSFDDEWADCRVTAAPIVPVNLEGGLRVARVNS